MDSGLGEVRPPVSFCRGRQGDGSGTSEGQTSSPPVLLCDLPRLVVELSRLELVVLADILAGLFAPSEDMAVGGSSSDNAQADVASPNPLEVLVEARGATIVLHEAAAFAEDPGPHSYVLNLGGACLHLGGSERTVEGRPSPLVTVSSGDTCVHETLRRSVDDRSSASGRRRIAEPLLFLPYRDVSTCPSVEDLPILGFVSGFSPVRVCSAQRTKRAILI